MDRNNLGKTFHAFPLESLSARRAWIEIKSGLHPLIASLASLSARRAWIEIHEELWHMCHRVVALRKESVDRNHSRDRFGLGFRQSLSARRAWIEMRKWETARQMLAGRSPQGERG